MADDRYRRDYPQHVRPEDQHTQSTAHSRASLDEARPDPRDTMAASVTLPSIQDPHGGHYAGQPPPPSRVYPPDARYASPSGGNGYPPPGQSGHSSGYLPPLQPQSDHRSQPYPADHRSSYYEERRHAQYSDYPPDSYYYRQQGQPPNGYPREYRGPPPPGPYPPDFGQGVGPQMAQAAPRQRTSIACRYCRKRKIRCSGYQSAPGGKCQNCARMNQECIFQPVSSSSSTAFVPLSAVQGGVPPGTQLFGAYGQPLAPSSVHNSHHYPSHSGGPPPPREFYGQPGQSPTEPYASFGGDPRDDPGLAAGKRPRDAMDRDEDWRRQGPRNAHDDDPRRRSPAEFSSKSSPGGGSYPYPAARHSPRASTSSTAGPQSRSPGGHTGSSGASTPVRQHGVPAAQGQPAPTSKMSLSNLVDKNDIDKTMIDRLNRPRDGAGPQPRD